MARRRLQHSVPVKLTDPDAERARDNHAQRIREIQSVPVLGGRLIKDVVLENGVDTPVAHGLGRKATVLISPPRGTNMTGEIIIPAAEMQPTSAANWFAPNGTADYWEYSAGANQLLHIPIAGLPVGANIIAASLYYRRPAGGANPTISFYTAGTSASGNLQTPTVAWTTGTDSTYVKLTASYSITVGSLANYYMVFDAANAVDRVRSASVTIDRPLGNIREERLSSYDPSRFFVLHASGYKGDVTVDAWVF